MRDDTDASMAQNQTTSLSPRSQDKELRMRYYMSIKGKGEFSETFIKPPAHWLNENLFVINQGFGDEEKKEKKNSSFITILSVWNTMIGSSIMSFPYCAKNAGIIPTMVLSIIYCLICFYTCQVIVKTGGNDRDYSDTVHRYFGKRYGRMGRIVQIIFNLLINIGATFIYFLIINQNLYPNLAYVIKLMGADIDPNDLTPSFSRFSISYCGIILGALMFPLLIKKDNAILIKINSYGIYFVSMLLLFVYYIGISSLFNTNYDFEYKKNKEIPPGSTEEPVRHLYLFGENPSLMAGSLTLGFFSHSFVLALMKNNAKQENNRRDLFYGYLLVALTYITIGILGYIGFTGKDFDVTFKDNWFLFFDSENLFILFLRLLSVIQLCTIFPILFFVVRVQLFGTFYQDSYPSRTHVIVYSLINLSLCFVVLLLCYNMLGKLLSVVGAATGLVLIYFIPLIVNIVYYRVKHPKGEQREMLINSIPNDFDDSGTTSLSKQTQPTQFNEILNGPHIISVKPPSKFKDIMFYISQIALMIFGVLTLVIQFVRINFFNVHIID